MKLLLLMLLWQRMLPRAALIVTALFTFFQSFVGAISEFSFSELNKNLKKLTLF